MPAPASSRSNGPRAISRAAYDGYVHGQSSYFVWLNRGKQSVALDFKASRRSRPAAPLIAKADVLIQNLAPGAAERAGFGSAAMRAEHKKLITVDISGYGDHGPYKNRRAYDLLVQAESGLASITGTEHAPGRVGISATDIGTGMYAHAAVLEALLARGTRPARAAPSRSRSSPRWPNG